MRRQQGYIQLLVIGIALAAAASAGFMLVKTYNGALAKASKLETENTSLQTSLNEQITEAANLRMEQLRLQGILKAREERKNGEEDAKRRYSDAIKELLAKDPEAKKWSDTPVPPAFIDSLRLNKPPAAREGNR